MYLAIWAVLGLAVLAIVGVLVTWVVQFILYLVKPKANRDSEDAA